MRKIVITALLAASALLALPLSSPAQSPETTPFQVPLPILEVVTPNADHFIDIVMKKAELEILPGKLTTVWAYHSQADMERVVGGNKVGSYLGPIIKAKSMEPVHVNMTNKLAVPTTVHLHGGHTPAIDDGYPTDGDLPVGTILIQPEAFRTYTYPNNQPAANLWYHDHTMDFTGLNVYMGLAGFYMLQDDFELGLNLPSGDYDIPLVIQDRTFNADGSLNYSPSCCGFLGDKILVNGAIQPKFEVANRKYRFRLLNGSNTRRYTLELSQNATNKFKKGGGSAKFPVNFTLIGSDGGLMPYTLERSSIELAPAERVEIVIDFSQYPIGTHLVLRNSEGSVPKIGDIMRFDVVREESDPSSLPETLRPFTAIDQTNVPTRTITLQQSTGGKWTLNNKPFSDAVSMFQPKINNIEIWEFINQPTSNMVHPMHIHNVMFQVLSVKDGKGNLIGPTVPGWKDTVAVPEKGGSVKVIMKFSDNLGKYVFHCHILEHEDRGMMARFDVVP